MVTRIAFVVVSCVSSIAAAEPDPARYIELSLGLAGRAPTAGQPDRELGAFGLLGFVVGTAWRDHLWLRGGLCTGPALGDITGGAGVELRGGIERRIPGLGTGVFYGVDLALAYDRATDDPDEAAMISMLAIPRAGIALGSAGFQAELAIGVAVGFGRVHDREPDLSVPLDAVSYHPAGGLDLDLAFAWQL